MFGWVKRKGRIELKPKCIMCLKENKAVSKCPKCGQYFCKDHFKHPCNEEKIIRITKIDPRYEQHWERTKPKNRKGQPWDEFTKSYRDVMFGVKTEKRTTVHRCAICNNITNTRICKECGHYFCLNHILPEDHNCGKINF